MSEQSNENENLKNHAAELEEQNLELHQMVTELQDQVRRIKLLQDEATDDSILSQHDISVLQETDKLHIPENIQLKNENQRLKTLNAALQEQQGNQKSRVNGMEHQIHKLNDDNKHLRGVVVYKLQFLDFFSELNHVFTSGSVLLEHRSLNA